MTFYTCNYHIILYCVFAHTIILQLQYTRQTCKIARKYQHHRCKSFVRNEKKRTFSKHYDTTTINRHHKQYRDYVKYYFGKKNCKRRIELIPPTFRTHVYLYSLYFIDGRRYPYLFCLFSIYNLLNDNLRLCTLYILYIRNPNDTDSNIIQ